MRPQLLCGLEALAIALQASALQMPLGRTASSRQTRSLSSRDVDISSNQHARPLMNMIDVSYYVNITLGSQEIPVHVDTGSADLWIPQPDGDFVTVNTTTVTTNVTYVKGSVAGSITFAEMSLAGFSIPSQAFISVNSTDQLDHAMGLIGLGFTGNSQIHDALLKAYGLQSAISLSRSPLTNIYDQNPALPKFFTIFLGRQNDPDSEDHGAFTIGEYIPQYASVAHSPKLPSLVTDHWGILVDEIRVGNRSVLLNSTVPSTPQGKAIAVLDSGFSLPPLPPHIISEIYGNIPGAIRTSVIPGYDLEGQWILPCDHPAELSIMIGGIEFPINPLDLVFATTLTLPGTGEQLMFCFNTYEESSLGADFDDVADMILGDAFLKNAYVAHYYEPYNVSGDAAEKPFMQLLPTTDIEQARREFPSVRAAQIARTNATVLSPAELVAKLLDISDNTTSSSSHEEPDTDTDAPPVRGVLAAQDDNENSTLSDFVSKFGPVIVGLLAGNVFLLIVVCSIAVYMCVTRSGKAPSTRTLPTTYQPLHLGGASEKQQLEPGFAGRYDA